MKSATCQDWLVQTMEKLQALARLPANWDSHGGLALQPAICHAAMAVLGWLENHELPVPGVVLGSSGTVQLEWQYDGRELQVEILTPVAIGWLKIAADGSMEEGHEPATPEQFRRLTEWLLRG